MSLIEDLKEQAHEFRIYAMAEIKQTEKERWLRWADTVDAAVKELENAP